MTEEGKKKKQAKPRPDKKQVEELTEDLKRIQADFINYRNRSEEEKARMLQLGKQTAVESLLPLIDDIERALAHTPEELADNSWAQGVTQVAKRIDASLKSMGVEKIGQEGEPFDPELHEAIGFEDGEGEEVIEEVMRTGYTMNGVIVRPAMVKVTKKSKEENNG